MTASLPGTFHPIFCAPIFCAALRRRRSRHTPRARRRLFPSGLSGLPSRPLSYPRVPQGCGSNWGFGDEICLLTSPSSSECSLVRQWRFWTPIRNFPGARKGFEEVLDWERPDRAIGRAASFWFPRRPTPATHGRAVASRPGPPKDEVRRFQRVFQFEFHCWNL